MRATIFAFLHGRNDYNLHNRLLTSIARYAPRDIVDVRMWFNTVHDETQRFAVGLHLPFVNGLQNIQKYEAMRQLFHPNGNSPFNEIKTPWIICFDDDAHITASDWWERTTRFIQEREHENICYIGQPWSIQWFPGQWRFVREQTWFKRKPPLLIRGRPGVVFAFGGYFWLRTDVLRMLDWPDARLGHNGGDYLLGEAIRQQGLALHGFDYGVKVNNAPYRGMNQVPLGSTMSLFEIPMLCNPSMQF